MEKRCSILYVDDEPINLLLFSNLFAKKYEVITAKSGSEGLHILSENKEIKAVISDMKMPGMNGIEFIQEAFKKFPTKIFFILTGYDLTSEIENAINTGLIKKYFQKPFKMEEIDKVINNELMHLNK